MEQLEERQRWANILSALTAGVELPGTDAEWAMHEIMRGTAGEVRVAGLLVGLRAKGETVAELDGLVRGMTAHAVTVEVGGPVLDIVGTGGDQAATVNISTMSAIVAAAAGARVVKHGNRASSSRCGSADLLEALGVVIDLPASTVPAVLDEVGIAFCFAPVCHPAMRHAAPVRRELGIPTAFNLLGPLTNPASPSAVAVGVAGERAAPLVAGVLARRGTSALVFRGDDGLDELTVTTTSRVWSVHDGGIREDTLDPRDVGIPLAAPGSLAGGDAAHNAAVTHRFLAGETGPVRDAVLLSAAAGLAAADPSDAPLPDRIAAGMDRAARAVDDGHARALAQRWAEVTTGLDHTTRAVDGHTRALTPS